MKRNFTEFAENIVFEEQNLLNKLCDSAVK